MNDLHSHDVISGTSSGPGAKAPVISKILQLPISSITPDPKNPRKHTKRQIRQIAESVKAFGFNVPVLIDSNNQLIAGHGRFEACKLLGWESVPTICLDHLSPLQVRAYNIADNKLTDNSTWDDALLAKNLMELSIADLGFNLDAIGMDMGEVDVRIHGLDDLKVDDSVDTSDQFDVPAGPAITESGDLWLLGPHRIICGDSTRPEFYDILMAGKLATMIFADPPYNVKINGHVSGKGAISHREFKMGAGEMSAWEFTEFLRTVFDHAVRHSAPGSIHFQCMDFRHLREMLDAGLSVYSELKNLCVWSKNTGGMGSLYRSRHELIFVFKHGTEPHINNVELGRHGRYRTNVWEYKSINSTRHSTDEGDLLAMHPTVKPVRMVGDAILDCSKRGDIVLDNFLGSGSTLIAAQRVGRICYGIEMDPLYVDTAIRRWQSDTGQDAVLASSGHTFTQRQKQRELGIERDRDIPLSDLQRHLINPSKKGPRHG